MQVPLDPGDRAPQAESQEAGAQNPERATHDVVGDKPPVIHSRCAGNRRYKSADDWNEPGEYDRLGTILFIEGMGAFQVNAELFIALNQRPAGAPSDHIARLIAYNGGHTRARNQPSNVEYAGCCKYAGGHE